MKKPGREFGVGESHLRRIWKTYFERSDPEGSFLYSLNKVILGPGEGWEVGGSWGGTLGVANWGLR